ncbi:MAG: hemolysin [Candidatus Amulumruptor caecigallinarius]|uniref:Hemolysin family protein n=1 Tax=Candidatus Amulumruptor caecigallinarius TaxID=2109911 RepID=A0A4V1LAE4_9BACT|nr:MAG: hemolysin [Candidatus Amulumruptor caecigallinarius]HJE40042.1 hemolysin family protein [Candidatus Amulumruptor caecigallinarius]
MLVLTIITLIFSALFSGVEIAYVTADRVRTQLDVEKGGFISRIIDRYYSSSQMFISTILVGNNIMLVIYGMGAAAILSGPIKSWGVDNEAVMLLLQTVISTLVILLTGEFIPKSVFRINPNSYLRFFAVPVWVFYIILYPISWFTTRLSRGLMKLVGVKGEDAPPAALSIADLNQYLERTIEESGRDSADTQVETEVKIFHNALDFSTIHLRDCMVPRNEIVAVDIEDTSREQLSALFTSSGRSKIIVYREDIDNIVGYIHVSELFAPEVDWTTKIKPVLFAPEALLAHKMMKRLLGEKRSVAIVIDEFGGTSGLVTLEDLMEEICGDIRDEHDKAEEAIKETAPGVYECSGRVEVETLRDMWHMEIPENSEYQTLAGYILYNTGNIPAKGEAVIIDDLCFTIIRRTSTRLELIRIEPAPDRS